MTKNMTMKDRIFEAIGCAPGCHLEDVVMSCPELRWNEIFAEVDRLGRTGELLVTTADHGGYLLTLPKRRTRTQSLSNSPKARSTAAAGR